MIRGTATAHSVAILWSDPVSAGIGAYSEESPGQVVSAGLGALKDMPVSTYWKAMGPPIVAEAGIGARKLVGRALRGIGGMFGKR